VPTPLSTGDQTEARIGPLGRLWALLRATVAKSAEEDAKDLGAAIAYYTFFSVFPLLVGLLAISGFFLDSPSVQQSIFDAVEDALPGSGAFVEENLELVIASRGALGLLGIVGLLWSGSAGFGAVSRTVNRAWGIRSEQPIFVLWVRYFLMTVVTVLLLTLSIGVTAMAEIVPLVKAASLEGIGDGNGLLSRLSGWSTSVLLVVALFALIYKVMPSESTRWREAMPGAVLAALLFEVGKIAVVFYLERVADFSVYGSLGSIIVLLLWLYFSARVLIFGAQFNVVLARSLPARRDGDG